MRLCCRLAGHHTVCCVIVLICCAPRCVLLLWCAYIFAVVSSPVVFLQFCPLLVPSHLPSVLPLCSSVPLLPCSPLSSSTLSSSTCHCYLFLSCPHLSLCLLYCLFLSSSLSLSSYFYLVCFFSVPNVFCPVSAMFLDLLSLIISCHVECIFSLSLSLFSSAMSSPLLSCPLYYSCPVHYLPLLDLLSC